MPQESYSLGQSSLKNGYEYTHIAWVVAYFVGVDEGFSHIVSLQITFDNLHEVSWSLQSKPSI